jgi:hypothetical protein
MSRPHGPMATGRIMSMKIFNDSIGNRTPDQARRSVMPQPTALPRVPTDMTKSNKLRKPYTCYERQIFPKPAGMLSNETWDVYHHSTTWGTKKGAPAWTKVRLSTHQMCVKHTADRKICGFCSVAIGASFRKMQRFSSHVITTPSHEACTARKSVLV